MEKAHKYYKGVYLLLASFLSLLLSHLSIAQDVNHAEVPDFVGRSGGFTHSVFESEARGRVYFNVYLPPGWSQGVEKTYPLLIFLHGQHQDEWTFPLSVPAHQLNGWIEKELIEPLVIIALRGADDRAAVQWYTPANERMLISEDAGELRAFCRGKFRAGLSPQTTSIQGFSRGASGTLYYALNFPNHFASAVANAFVSDYVLEERKEAARDNLEKIVASGLFLRMMVGSEDGYEKRFGRRGTHLLHDFLEKLGIPHEYEVLKGAPHDFCELWNYSSSEGLATGLYELRCHSKAWRKEGAGTKPEESSKKDNIPFPPGIFLDIILSHFSGWITR